MGRSWTTRSPITYDALGRMTGRAINGVGLTQTYDALGRVTTEVNVQGTFTYEYESVSSRLVRVTYPNGQGTTYSYLPAAPDHRLQTIHHQHPGGATVIPRPNVLAKLQPSDDSVVRRVSVLPSSAASSACDKRSTVARS